MVKGNALQVLVKLGILDAVTVRAVEAAQAGDVPPGDPLDIDELMDMAEITPEVIAAAQAEWEVTAPDWARDLLDVPEWSGPGSEVG